MRAPENRPLPEEIARCLPYLSREMEVLRPTRVVVALGRIAFDGFWDVLAARGCPRPRPRPQFRHGGLTELESLLTPRAGLRPARSAGPRPSRPVLLASYHPSQQNTQTGRLTASMFDEVFLQARRLAGL